MRSKSFRKTASTCTHSARVLARAPRARRGIALRAACNCNIAFRKQNQLASRSAALTAIGCPRTRLAAHAGVTMVPENAVGRARRGDHGAGVPPDRGHHGPRAAAAQ